MSLDFVILDQSGAPEKSISLGVDLHHEFVTAAAISGLECLRDFEDYYEDVEITIDRLTGVIEQIEALLAKGGSVELRRFLVGLEDLTANALAQRKSLHAIAD